MPIRSEYSHGVPCWADLSTAEVGPAREFYGELFGWGWEAVDMDGGRTYWTAHHRGERVAGLSAPPPDLAGAPPAWMTWINVSGVDDGVARAEANGASVVAPAFDVPDFGRGSIVADPAGAAFGLWQSAGHIGAGLVDEHGTAVWHELLALNTDGAAAFYGAVFGWVRGTMEFPHGVEYTTLFAGITTVGGTAFPTDGVPPGWRVWFGSDDVDGTVATAKTLGGTVARPPTDSPIGKFAHLADPTGAHFCVIATG